MNGGMLTVSSNLYMHLIQSESNTSSKSASIILGSKKKDEKPLSALKVLDIGCGGGLVCEPLSRLGADVTGIDASYKNIEVAKIHAKKNDLKIKYFNTSPEKKRSK